MWELRWILAGLGVALIAVLYFWGRYGRKPFSEAPPTESTPTDAEDPDEAVGEREPTASPPVGHRPKRSGAQQPQKVIALRLVSRSEEISTEAAVLALREAGLRLGRYGIFHLAAEDGGEDPAFSIASLVEPGSFDLENMQGSTIPGLSIFMVLPGGGDPVAGFDRMVHTSRELARVLDAELFDDRGSSWNIQRERYLREELIAYRHQVGRGTK